MSERKVLNKYYPPDFDPTKIPKLKGPRNKVFNIRVMAPFNMRCNTCGEYIYKGKKFNSRKETVENEDYLGLHIFRFYIKCPRCVAEIAFKTDPENTDYTLEAGATRNFEAAKTAMAMAVKEQKAKEEEEMNNPMKVLENRTKASRNEMERIENLEELRELNSRHAKVDHETMIQLHAAYEEQLQKLQDEEDEAVVSAAFGRDRLKRLADDSDSDSGDDGTKKPKPNPKDEKPTDIFLKTTQPSAPASSTTKPRDALKTLVKPKQNSLKGLVVKKTAKTANSDQQQSESNSNSHTESSNGGEVSHGGNDQGTSTVSSQSQKDDGEVLEESDKKIGSEVSQGSEKKTGALSLLGNYSESDESD